MRILTAQLIATLLLLQPTLTSAADNITDDLLNGKINADINTRYEHAARDGLKAAEATTIRSRLGYTTDSFYDLSAKLEIENIWSPFRVAYDDGTNNRTRFTRVADPETTELNQAFLQYAAFDSTLRAGRQVITLDDKYFIGDSAWRQNQTSYDAVRVETKALPHLTANYAYIFKEQNNLGYESPAGRRDSNSHALNASTDIVPFTAVRVFIYQIDLQREAPTLSSTTFGLEAEPKYQLTDDLTISGLGSIANQQDVARNPNDYSLNFYRLLGGADYRQFTAKIGYEVFEGNGTASFTRPFGNNFTPQGRSDVISTKTTIANGLKDLWGRAEYRLTGVHEAVDGLLLGAEYHAFNAEHVSRYYGSEYNFYLTKSFGKYLSADIYWADYTAENLGTDTQKFIAQLTFKY